MNESFPQDLYPLIGLAHATVSSVADGDWVNMENHAYCTVLIQTGTITVGSNVGFKNAVSKSGSSSAAIAAPFVNDVYYKARTKTSVTSSGSVHYMNIANGDDNTYLVGTVEAVAMSTAKPYLAMTVASSTMNGAMGAWYILHGTRYKQASVPDPTA